MLGNDDHAKDWMKRIELGDKAKDQIAKPKDWDLYRNMYRGVWDSGYPILNRVYSTGKALIPRVYFRSPTVTISPKRPEFAAHARLVEAIDNWLIKEVMLKVQIKRSIGDAYLCGTGPIKIGYDSEFGFSEEQSIDQDQGTLTQTSKKSGQKIEYKEYINRGMPWAMRVLPDDVITPYGYDDPKAMPWICHRILRPLSDVKEDAKYDKNATKDLKGGYIPDLIKDSTTPKIIPYDFKNLSEAYCLLYEVRDARTGRIYVFCEDKTILDLKDACQVDGLPWEFIIFNEDPEYFWGTPDVKYILPQQLELNEIKAMVSKLRKINIIKWLVKKGAIKPEDLQLLLSTNLQDINAAIEINDENIQSSVMPMQPHNLTGDLLNDEQAVLSDLRETIGFSRNQMGEFIDKTSKTATEANLVQQGSDIRTDERKDAVADIFCNIIRKFNQLIFKYWTSEKMIEITGPSGQKDWVEYTGDQLKGEYFISVDIDSGMPINRNVRTAQGIQLFEMFNMDPMIDQVALRKTTLQNFDWVDPTASLLLQEPQGGMQVGVPEGAEPSIMNMQPIPKPPSSSPAQPIPFGAYARKMQQGGR